MPSSMLMPELGSLTDIALTATADPALTPRAYPSVMASRTRGRRFWQSCAVCLWVQRAMKSASPLDKDSFLSSAVFSPEAY